MALVSIVMPTFNRADTIQRAIRSIQAQTFQDWELIVVDDGSTDGTADRLQGLDPRLKVIRQENQGITGARNTGVANCSGEFLAFQDSDDEWRPYHLELCLAFLQAHPKEAFVGGELWEYYGKEKYQKHYMLEMGWYTETAREIGSKLMDLPPGETDGYLRVYPHKEPIGEWGRAIAEREGHGGAHRYHGDIFQHFRWGYLFTVQAMLFRRKAFDEVGPFDRRYWNASDVGLIAKLCRKYPANFLSLPLCVKHEYTEDGELPAEGHLVTGRAGLIFAKDMLGWLEELFYNEHPDDPELIALRSLAQLFVAKVAIRQGRRDEAMMYLDQSVKGAPWLKRAAALRWALKILPSTEAVRAVSDLFYSASSRWLGLRQKLRRGLGLAATSTRGG